MEDLGITPVPYFPSTEWLMGRIFRENALRAPNESPALSPRDFTRTLIASNSPEGMVLTVPIVGGRGRVKHGDVQDFRISDHGDWTRIHLGALDAAYGREPYFPHLFYDLAEWYDEERPDLLWIFNAALWGVMKDFMRLDETLPEIQNASDAEKARFASLRDRMLSKTDPVHTFLEPLFRFGPDAIFLLV